jgi:glucose/mannose-6-phosphate isomerase
MGGGFQELKQLGESLDKSDMLGLVTSFPVHMDDAWQRGHEFAGGVERTTASTVVVCGMGGSAIGGDMVRSFLGDRLEVPLYVNRGYTVPPALVAAGFFVFSSYSGNTAETLSAYRSVRESDRPRVAITSGGELASLCKEDGVPVCEIPGGMPPRAAIAYSFFPLLQILTAVGAATVADGEREEARTRLEAACRTYTADSPDNTAVRLARQLANRLPVVYSGTGLLEAVARRWSTQLNENSKSLAHYAAFPELSHNEIVGWNALAAIRESIVVVRLDDEEDEAVARTQAGIAMEIIEPHCAGVVNVSGLEGGRLTRILSAMILGDFVSVYLAYLNGVDPTPVENIDLLKQRLRQGR